MYHQGFYSSRIALLTLKKNLSTLSGRLFYIVSCARIVHFFHLSKPYPFFKLQRLSIEKTSLFQSTVVSLSSDMSKYICIFYLLFSINNVLSYNISWIYFLRPASETRICVQMEEIEQRRYLR